MESKIIRLWLIISLIISLSACSSPEQQAPLPPPGPNDNLLMEAANMQYLYSDNARLSARLSAKHVEDRNESKEDKTQVVLVRYMDKGVKVEFFTPTGQVETVVTANRAIYRDREGLAELKGNVIVNNQLKGERMETEQLFWDRKADKIYNNIFVRIVTPDKTITGDNGISSDSKFSRYSINGVRGTFVNTEFE